MSNRKPYKKLHNSESLIQAIVDMLVNSITQLKHEFNELKPREKFYFIERVLPAVNKYMEIERAAGSSESLLENKRGEIDQLLMDFKNNQKFATA